LKVRINAKRSIEINRCQNGVRVVIWFEAGILSWQPGFESLKCMSLMINKKTHNKAYNEN